MRRTRQFKPQKIIDEISIVRCSAGDGAIREEVWEGENGAIVRYSLAFINFHLFARDNGRVLGYDNAHGAPHRHFAGEVEPIGDVPYDQVFERFLAEVAVLKNQQSL